jgi:hypothetical protein
MSGSKNYGKYREILEERLRIAQSVDSAARDTVAPSSERRVKLSPDVSRLCVDEVSCGRTCIVPHLGAHLAEIVMIQGRRNQHVANYHSSRFDY